MGTNCYWCQKSSEMAIRAVERSIASWRKLVGQPANQNGQVSRNRSRVTPTRRVGDRKNPRG